MSNVPATTTFPVLLKSYGDEIARALPKHLDPDRMSRIALTAFRQNPKLAECDPRSVFAAVIQASQLGLEPNLLGRSYLVPYAGECTFIPGWRGLVELLQRSGSGMAWTGTVFEGDDFHFQCGSRPDVQHTPRFASEVITYVYAVGWPRDAQWPVIEVWTMDRVFKHRDRYNKVGKRHYSYQHPEMYARKVVLLQVLKYMPLSADLQTAVAMNDAGEVGRQGLTVSDAIEGTWAPAPEEPEVIETKPPIQEPKAKEPKAKEPKAKEPKAKEPPPKPEPETKGSGDPEPEPKGDGALISEGQKKMLYAKLHVAGVTAAEFEQQFGVTVSRLPRDRVKEAVEWVKQFTA